MRLRALTSGGASTFGTEQTLTIDPSTFEYSGITVAAASLKYRVNGKYYLLGDLIVNHDAFDDPHWIRESGSTSASTIATLLGKTLKTAFYIQAGSASAYPCVWFDTGKWRDVSSNDILTMIEVN
jgi:hypothetical protein